MLLLDKSGPLRASVEKLAERRCRLEDMPHFHKIVCRFLLLNVNDRQCERPHAEVKRALSCGTDSKIPTLDLQLRCTELRKVVGDGDGFHDIVQHLDALPNAKAILKEHNLQNHPDVVDCFYPKISAAWPVVHRYDKRSQHKSRRGERLAQKGAMQQAGRALACLPSSKVQTSNPNF